MSLLFAALFVILPHSAEAITFQVLGRGAEELYRASEAVDIPASAGAITILFLERAKREKGLAYEGDEKGIVSIGGLAPEVKEVGKGEIRSYGWCFSVNGFAPEEMPNHVEIHDPNARIVWFYGYARFRDDWVSQCEPSE